MSQFDVYKGDMPERTLSERDMELLLSGSNPDQESLVRFAAVLRSLHDPGSTVPSDEAVSAFATEAARVAVDARENAVEPGPASRGKRRSSSFYLRRKLAGGLAAAVLLSGMTGVAVAADGAVPGDPLYGLDRAMETIGLGDGGPSERITEAQALFNEGRVGEAIEHAAEAVETTDMDTSDDFSPEATRAAEALIGAAERATGEMAEVDAQGLNDTIAGVLSEIAALLESDELDPSEFGARISELARSIGAARGDAADREVPASDRGPSGSNGNGPPDDRPGGPPQDATSGSPDDTAPSGPPAGVPGRP